MADDAPQIGFAQVLIEIGKIQGALPQIGREIGVLREEMNTRDTAHNEWLQRVETRLTALEASEHQRAGRLKIFEWLNKVPPGVWAFFGIHWEGTHK